MLRDRLFRYSESTNACMPRYSAQEAAAGCKHGKAKSPGSVINADLLSEGCRKEVRRKGGEERRGGGRKKVRWERKRLV